MKKVLMFALAVACALFSVCGCGKDCGDAADNEPSDGHIRGEISELLTVEELVEFHYNGAKYPENFVFAELQGYGRVLNSSSSADEARAVVESHFTNSMNTTVENSLEVETELFYGLYAKWEHRSQGSNEPTNYDEHVVSFKSGVYDAESGIFGTEDKDDIKKIIDYIYYSQTYQIGGSKVYDSEISVKDGKYRYLIYTLQVSYGDWGMQDALSLTKDEWLIDIATGKTEKSANEILGTVFVDGALTY